MLKSELEVLDFWDEKKVFEKSLQIRKGQKPFVFLDGPPFATGTPHWGHIFISQVKDTVLRYQTQKGYYVPRRWGWDCHGVPIEALIEKELNIKDKRQIEEEIGIEAFNEGCRSKIFTFDKKWREVIHRIGRWVDMDDQYRTMDNDFIESIWWGLHELWKKDLLYKDYRISLYSPSMGVPLSHTDVAMEVKYENETIESPIVRFLADKISTKKVLNKIGDEIISSYAEQITYKEEISVRIENFEKRQIKKSPFSRITQKDRFKNISLEDFEEEVTEGKELEYLQDQLEIAIQNIALLDSLKNIISSQHPLSLLAWTTTPWTLPANVCLTVGEDIDYSLYFLPESQELVILAENRAKEVISLKFKEVVVNSPEVHSKLEDFQDSGEYFKALGVNVIKIATFKGKDLVGLSYQPLFNNPQFNESYDKEANLHKIYSADFVTDQDGTGIIHIAAYGEDDFNIIKKHNLPIILSLNEHGEVLSNLDEKLEPVFGKKYEASNPIINKILERDGDLFEIVKYKHTVPFFDRDGKKVYYAPQESWFIGETKLKDRSLELNEKINWYPEHLKHGRFGKGLETAPDWSISRKRYWGNPMPIWQTLDAKQTLFIDSMKSLAEHAINPIYRLINSNDINPSNFENGRCVIFSDVESKIPLGINTAQYRSKALSELRKLDGRYDMAKFAYIAQNMLDEIIELFNKYTTVQIMLKPDEERFWTTWLNGLHPNSKKVTREFYFYKKVYEEMGDFVATGAPRLLDLHRPYIDDFILKDEVGNIYYRIEEVLDCWVESGSMPWASNHYPFENKRFVEESSPADWIVEAQDQTRGWFRVLHVLSNGVFDKQAFNNISTSGLILASDGKKMSKSKKNYADPDELLSKFGSDAIRLYLMSSALLNAESVRFVDRDLQTVFRNSTLTLANVATFFANSLQKHRLSSPVRFYKHPLNKWLIAYTKNYAYTVNKYMSEFNLTEAARCVIPYIEDLSTWYIRRAKDMDEEFSLETASAIQEAGKIFAVYSAALQPFNSEKIWSVVRSREDEESVHLTTLDNRIKPTPEDLDLINKMTQIQNLVSGVHSVRKEYNHRVRQPLYADFSSFKLSQEYLQMVKDECNLLEKDMSLTEGEVYEVKTDFGLLRVDLVVDRDLQVLGFVRDFERAVQAFRKNNGFKAGELVKMKWDLVDSQDEEMTQEVIKNLDWKKLNIEVSWVKTISKNTENKFEVKNLVTVLVV